MTISTDGSSTRKKITWLLLLQGWTMLWVIIGHAPLASPPLGSTLDLHSHNIADALFNFAYSFHMPLFIMISGYLFHMTRIEKKWAYNEVIKEKWLRLGIPYILFITLAIGLKFLVPSAVTREVGLSYADLISNYTKPFTGALQEMWFIAVIFWYFLLYPLYPYLLRTRISLFLTLACSVCIFFIPVDIMPDLFCIGRAVHFFVFFFLGLGLHKLNGERLLDSWGVIGLLFLIFFVAYYFHIPLLTPVTGSLSFWGLAIKIDKSLSSNLFSSFRNYTYQIFLIGIFVQIAVKFLYSKYNFAGSYPIWWFICVILGIYVPVIISKIALRTDNRFIKMIFGL